MGISEGKEPTVVARSYALAPFRGASADPAAVQPYKRMPSPSEGAVEKPVGEVDGIIRKLPAGVRGILSTVAGVSVKDAGPAAPDQTTWQALDLRVDLRLPVLKRDVFVGVAGQW